MKIYYRYLKIILFEIFFQEQVEDGIPLSLCLSRFKYWLQSQAQEHKMSYNTSSDACPNLCTIVTWSGERLFSVKDFSLKYHII